MKVTVRGTIETDVDTYWDAVFFDPEFNRRVYLEALGFRDFELLELTGEPGERRTRKMRSEPATELPAALRKLAGGPLTYVESGAFDPATKEFTYALELSALGDKADIRGRLRVEPKGEKRCERIAELDISVRVFGVGGTIERFIAKTIQESYAKATGFTNRFIAENRL